ncbi:MAG: ketoacyl-ACP synthase III [Bacteroidales bacterium]|nr:ketoacyl-ACP synthase III [Bacteroidales bacterium]
MAILHTKNIKIKGMSACVPTHIEDNKKLSLLGSVEEAQRFVDVTGIEYRRMVKDTGFCTSDLCFHAAEKLIAELNWAKEEIDCLIFVTQTPDYILPATSCILQHRLGLPIDCYSMDISLGCSGWVYGLSTISALLSSGTMKKGLLLVGDTTTVTKSDRDKSTYPLFGDAGTATALEFVEGEDGIKFQLGTDGKGFESIIIPDGGFRNFPTQSSFEFAEIEQGQYRNRLQSILDGPSVFTFGITKAPRSVNTLLETFGIEKEQVDYFVFHQANKMMNEKIRTKLKIEPEKVPYSLGKYGNTSSASIPLTMISELKKQLEGHTKQIVVCAFGVGLSWASASFELDNVVCPPIVEV